MSALRNKPTAAKYLCLALFAASLLVSVYIFVLVQILPPQDVWLQSAIPFRGHYGEDTAPWGLSFIQTLELSGAGSFVCLFLYRYLADRVMVGRERILSSISAPMLFFGTTISGIVYTEIHLLWGEVWYGLKFVDSFPQGFPWGNERVATNTCFIHGTNYIPSYGSYCWFFNYDQLLAVSLASVLLGLLLRRRTHRSPDTTSE